MKKSNFLALAYQLASPVLLMVLGLVLILSPDSASVLIARVLGWLVTVVGVCFGIAALTSRGGMAGKVLAALVCLSLGSWLVANPLRLAASIGRFLGILVALRGLRDLFLARETGCGLVLAAITTLVGLVLIVLPLTTSRLVFSICGAAVLGIGAAMLVQRLRRQRLLDSGDKPDIIDAL